MLFERPFQKRELKEESIYDEYKEKVKRRRVVKTFSMYLVVINKTERRTEDLKYYN